MRQRVVKLLAAFLLTVAGLAATAVAAGATGEDDSTSVVVPIGSAIDLVGTDAAGWE